MRIPPASILSRRPTVQDVLRWPDYFITGPGRELAKRTECPHHYLLTDSCPGCDADIEAAGIDPTTLLDQSSPDEVTDVIAVYRQPDGYSGFTVYVNGQFIATATNYAPIVMQHVAHLGGQVVVRYEDDDSMIKRAERVIAERSQAPWMQRGLPQDVDAPPIVLVEDESHSLLRGGSWDGCGPTNPELDKPS